MTGSATDRRRFRAFTLVEVLVSLAILGIAGLVLASGFAGFLHNYDAAYKRTAISGNVAFVRAAVLAQPDREVAESWNDITLPGQTTARWRAIVTATDIADLFNVECEVEMSAGGHSQPETTTFKLTLLRPTWSQPDERETLRAASRDRLADRQFE